MIDVTIQSPLGDPLTAQCGWRKGNWELWELETVEEAVTDIAEALNGSFRSLMGHTDIKRVRIGWAGKRAYSNASNLVLPDGVFYREGNDIPKGTPDPEFVKYDVAHEYAHIWDWRNNYEISHRLHEEIVEGETMFTAWGPVQYRTWVEPPLTEYGYTNSREDWEETFAAYVYPVYVSSSRPGGRLISRAPIRYEFVSAEVAP